MLWNDHLSTVAWILQDHSTGDVDEGPIRAGYAMTDRTPRQDKGSQEDVPAYGPNSLHQKRKEHIVRTLELTEYNYMKTAALLEISVAELKRWLKVLGIRHSDTV